jgi:hypothetical protein
MLDKQIDLVDRRLLQGQVIAAGEKIHSFLVTIQVPRVDRGGGGCTEPIYQRDMAG